jgi:membrane-bound metal-dependent hydrolase YbcI (DUF457 family)
MLLFAHLGLALAAARLAARSNLLFVAIGAMLPDIIDKPLGELIYGTPNMGRIFAHTLLLLLLLGAAAYYTRDVRLASLCGGVLVHLLLDFMWLSPTVLLWPLLGGFPVAAQMDAASYLQMLLLGLKKPEILLPEILGLAYLVYLLVERRQDIVTWIKKSVLRIRGKCKGAAACSIEGQ